MTHSRVRKGGGLVGGFVRKLKQTEQSGGLVDGMCWATVLLDVDISWSDQEAPHVGFSLSF